MRTFRFHHVDVFTDRPLSGNPLAVFTQPQGLADAEMQAIALEFNLAETVFCFPPITSESIARLRIFTPRRELAFAGHPTVGAVATLLAEGANVPDTCAVDEGVGPIALRIERDGILPRVWMTTPPVAFGAPVARADAAAILGLDEDDLAPQQPAFASAGSPFLFVAVRDRDAVDRAAFAGGLPTAACPDVVGVFVFTTAHEHPAAPYAVYSRMFAPWSGIAEDPATGGATGPLAAYLLREGLVPSEREIEIVSEQGVRMGRRSIVRARVTPGGGDPTIEVGGSAVPFATGEIVLADTEIGAEPGVVP